MSILDTLYQRLLREPTDSETIDFIITQVVREALLAKSTQPQKSREVLTYINRTYNLWFDPQTTITVVPWTENHLAGLLSSRLLIAHELNTADYGSAREDTLLFLQSRLRFGISEILSPTYIPYTISGLLNFYDFAPDLQIRELTYQIINRIFRQIAQVCNPTNGNIHTACTRLYVRNLTKKYYSEWKMNVLTRYLCGLPLGDLSDDFPARAITTTSYVIPSDITQIIEYRRHNDYTVRIHNPPQSTELTIPPLTDEEQAHYRTQLREEFDEQPYWIKWSYGEFVNPKRPIGAVNYLYDNNLLDHPQFNLGALSSNIFRYALIVVILVFYPLVYFFLDYFLSFFEYIGQRRSSN